MKRLPRALLLSSLLVEAAVFAPACGGSGTSGEIPVTGDPGSGPAGSSGTPAPAPTGTTPGPKGPDVTSPVDLRADTNRDGVIEFDDPTDDDGEDAWDAKHGAVFLANIDDDEQTCPTNVSDVDLPKCNDAADEVVNGADDAKDLARLETKPWAAAPDGATGKITTSAASSVRLFKVTGTTFEVLAKDATLTTAELRAGVKLAIEARDIVRDTAA